MVCTREALGVIAASRGQCTGAVTLIRNGTLTALDNIIHAIGGDVEHVRQLEFAQRPEPARFVLVVEKDTVFRRLVDDGFTRLVPSVIVTASEEEG